MKLKVPPGKEFRREGMALISVLAVMVILLILSLAIVNLSIGNLRTVGNISARLRALNLANTACMYAIYEIQSDFISSSAFWDPGYEPGPDMSLSFVVYPQIPVDRLNGIDEGRCSVAYINNLDNPNERLSIPVPGSSPFIDYIPSVDVFGEGAVILAQGQYGAFKRTIKVSLKRTYFASAADSQIDVMGGDLLVTGIGNITTLAPGSGNLYCGGDISYDNLNSFRILNGSLLCSTGTVNSPPATGQTIPDRFTESGHSAINTVDWDFSDPVVTEGEPFDAADYPLNDSSYSMTIGTFPTPSPPEPMPIFNIARPSFSPPYAPVPVADGDQCFILPGNLTIADDTFINGNLHVQGSLTLVDANLFVNGILVIEETIDNSSRGNIFVAGYIDDPTNTTSVLYNNGLALHLRLQTEQGIDTSNEEGVGIFTDGDVKIGALGMSHMYTFEVNSWMQLCPPDTDTIISTFEMLGLNRAPASDANGWYFSSTGSKIPVSVSGKTGGEVLKGQANDELIDMGLAPVPEEVSKWFSDVNADSGFDWATIAGNGVWETFRKNPTLYTCANDVFLQAVIYTHGTLKFDNFSPGLWPTRIVGSVVANDKSGVSPQTLGVSHGGIMELNESASIVFYPEYFNSRSGKFIVEPILDIYAWEELY